MARLRIPTRAEVVVVGGGCMGASTAFHLARRGVDVVLVERGHIGSGATGHSGAIIRQHYETRLGIGLARRSLLFFRRFKEETGHSCDFHETGFLSGTRAPDVPAFDALLRLLTSEGVRAERLSPDGAQQLEPQLAVSDYVALVHDPEAGYADPAVTAVGFAKAAESLGGTIRQDVDVRGLVVRGGQIAGVRLGDGGQIKTSNVVLAAGTWTRMLARAV
ncbi:MAG TPA: FAD-dependent oxidoreductase, partial [Thermoplasmata archaeon]|nr:FAD-dependent oxidoreductase [Thermoplasmata archaeon]